MNKKELQELAIHMAEIYGVIITPNLIDETEEDTIRVCSYCSEEIEIKSAGDESWDYCPGCEQIEGPTEEITIEEYEK